MIRKGDLAKLRAEEVRKEVEILEKRIDDSLIGGWEPDKEFNVSIPEDTSESAVKVIISKYESAGWDIKYHSVQRDGCWFSLK